MVRVETEYLIDVQDLSLEFDSGQGRFTALDEVSFNIEKGESLAIVGESGAGKSLLALSLMRLIQDLPNAELSGKAIFNSGSGSFDLCSATESQMNLVRGSEIGMVFQEPSRALNPAIRCGEQIQEVLRRHLIMGKEEAEQRTIELLHRVGHEHPFRISQSFPGQLSGGQSQRVMVAMALACRPRLLLADEPTSGQDAVVRRKVVMQLNNQAEFHDMSVLYITHDLELARHMASKVVVLYAGKVVEQGITEEVLSNPQHPYTKGLINCVPPKKSRYYFLPTVDDFMRISESGTEYEQLDDVSGLFDRVYISDDARKGRHEQIYSKPPILKIEELSRTYYNRSLLSRSSEVKALRGVSCEVFQGETLGIVGMSGSGKSSLAKALVGIDLNYEGHVLYFNKKDEEYEELRDPRTIGKRAQYIFQNAGEALNPEVRIGLALLEVLQQYFPENDQRVNEQRVYEALAQVGLKPYHFRRFPHEFSGGQRQRISIARALLAEPSILICDEPTSALDASVQANVLNLLNELKYEYNLCLIFISHDLNVVRFMSDRIMVMHNGEVVALGEADQVCSNADHPAVHSLMSPTV